MSMVIKNNMSAVTTLNRLAKNSNALARSLEKVSSGMRINGAADDASGYAISERMRVQMRGLEQADRNTQNASSLMKVAEGAVSSTVEILKTLKEKALDAANDTNTDSDRRVIQREIDQAVDQVDDNAHVTFNGKYLVNGSHELPSGVQELIVKALHTEWLENSLDLIEEAYGVNFRNEAAAVKDITVRFTDSSGVGGSNVLAAVASLAVPGEKAQALELRINMDHFNDLDVHDTSNVNGENPAGTGVLDRTIAHEMTHAIMASSIAGMASLPLAVKEGMAELVHGIDDLRNLVGADPTDNTAGTDGPYTGGYAAFRYMAHQSSSGRESLKKFMQVLVNKGAGALDEAVSYATNGKFSGWTDLTNQFAADNASADAAHLEEYCGIILDNADTGSIIGSDAGGKYAKDGDTIVPEGGSTKFWYAPGSQQTTINGLRITWESDYGSAAGDMAFQVGTRANQAIKVGFMDMTAEGLGLKAVNGEKVSVVNQDKANDAIRLFDQSINKALSQQTTIGSILSRLEYTSANLVTAAENVQNAESTIRDSDMAKEMVEYTKNNVLLQAAQSMLAQANQNSSGVLSLLQ